MPAEDAPGDVRLDVALARAVELARSGLARVEPNPPVGAVVLAADGAVVGEGAHEEYGGPHAEVVALSAAGPRARGGTLIVSLEPCTTSGKTPPCTDAIARAGIARVLFAAADPNPRHRDRARERLQAAGVAVLFPREDPAAAALLARFREHLAATRPFVTLKWAASLDGAVATAGGESKWITGEAARAAAHALRRRCDAVAVGVGTVIADRPALTARPPGPRPLTRVVFDRTLRLPLDWQALGDGQGALVVVHEALAPADRRTALQERGVVTIEAEGADEEGRLRDGLRRLRGRGIDSLLVEGGPTLLGAMLDAGCADRVAAFVAPLVLGGGRRAIDGRGAARLTDALRLEHVRVERHGDDGLWLGLVARSSDR